MKRRDLLKAALLAPAAAALPFGLGEAHGAARTTIRIGHLPLTDHLLVLAAGRERLARVDLQPVKFSSWPELAEAVKAGAVDGAFLLTPIGLTLRKKGVPVKALLLGHRNGSVLTVRNSPQIGRIEDLRGRTLAIPSPFSTHNLLIRKALTDRKLNPLRDVRIIDMAPPEMPVALATGRIDGFMVAEPFGAQAEARRIGKVLMLSRDIWPDHICCVLNVHERIIQSRPEAVQELVSALIRTAAFIETRPAEAARLSLPYIGQRAEIVEKVLTSPPGRLSFTRLAPERSDFEATQELMVRFGVTTERINLGGYLEDRFAKRV